MINKKRILSCTLFLAFAFSALVASGQESPGAEELKAALDKYYGRDYDTSSIPSDGELRAFDICRGTFTVDYIYPIGDPHLKEEERFAILGPFVNIFLVWPLSASSSSWDHSWQQNMYIGTPSMYSGWFDLKPVGVEPHGMEEERDHEYIMRPSMPNSRGCPTYVEFHSLYHVGEGPIRHPGHAGAAID